MALFDSTQPQYNDYYDPALVEYNANKARLSKAIATEKKAHPWWTAASGIASSFIPFGLGAVITPAANAMVQANKKKRLASLAEEEAALDRPQFSYGFGERGAMFARQSPHSGIQPMGEGLDLSGIGFAAGSSIATGLGRDIMPGEGQGGTLNFSGGLGGLSSAFARPNNTSMAAFSAPQSTQPTMDNGGNMYAPTTGSEGLYQAFQNRQDESYQVAPANNVTAPANSGIQSITGEEQWGYKKGGKMVVGEPVDFEEHYSDGGKMKYFANKSPSDNIALVNEDTGKDTGVRVSEGEMLVVSKDNVDALHKAIKDENLKKVFAIMKKQVNQKPTVKDGEKGYAGGGVLPKEYLEVVEKVTGKKDKKDLTEKEWFAILEEIPKSVTATKGGDVYDIFDKAGFVIPVEAFQRAKPQPQSGGIMNSDIYGVQNASIPQIPDFSKKDVGEPYVTSNSLVFPEDVPRGTNWRDNIENSIGTGFDLYRLGEGLAATRQPLPQFHKSAAWNDVLNRSHQQSLGGLTPAETAFYNSTADRQYGADVGNIYNLSGGNAGAALGNLGRANMNRYQSNLQLAALDRNAMSNNLSQYSQLVNQDMGFDRRIFEDKFNLGMMNKQSGATLAKDAIENMQQRNLTDRYYGYGSEQGKLQRMYGARMQNENDILNAQRNRYLSDPDAFNPNADFGGTYNVDRLNREDDEIEKNGWIYTKRRKAK